MHTMNRRETIVSVIGAFVSTLLATFFSDMILSAEGTHIILASTGATAILVFGMPHVQASQPWNIIGGHLVSAFVGVTCYLLIPIDILAASVAIPVAMYVMHSLRCMHPPGGATAITAVIGGESVHHLGYSFLIVPVFFNAIIVLSIAISVATFRDKNPYL
jgi:CBS domain-containing membrane protein